MRLNLRLFVACCVLAGAARADNNDAQKLKDEALEILKANAHSQATPAQYALCIYKLEQAQAMLEKAKDDNSSLAQEVSSSLFWARRFSNLQILKELDKLRAGAPAPKVPEPSAPKKKTDDDDAPPPTLALAQKAYQAAEQFEKSHGGDDYAIALRWFQMANEHNGTDFALKALDRARKAQARFAAKGAQPATPAADTPELKLCAEAAELAKQEKYEESFAIYKTSLKMKETIDAHRGLAHAYFMRAQQMKDELTPECVAAETAWREARAGAMETVRTLSGMKKRLNPNYPPLVEANKKIAALQAKIKTALTNYDHAQDEFGAVLRLAPGKKDLDAAGHQALCVTVRTDASVRARGRQMVASFLQEYSPANDLERSLYEFCKSELARMSK
ncbi:MAG TPA: hypothetical protein VGP72_21695 [Planctomycetota bacterium]|jgi:hypothetical protein